MGRKGTLVLEPGQGQRRRASPPRERPRGGAGATGGWAPEPCHSDPLLSSDLFVRVPSWCSPSTTNVKRQGRQRTSTPRWKGHGGSGAVGAVRVPTCVCGGGGAEKHRDSEGQCEYPRDHGSHKHQTPLAPGSSPMQREVSAWSERLGKASPQRRGMCRVSRSREERQRSRHRNGVCKGPVVTGH